MGDGVRLQAFQPDGSKHAPSFRLPLPSSLSGWLVNTGSW